MDASCLRFSLQKCQYFDRRTKTPGRHGNALVDRWRDVDLRERDMIGKFGECGDVDDLGKEFRTVTGLHKGPPFSS